MQTIPYRRWNPPQSLLHVEFSPALLHAIRPNAQARETRGVLFGWCQGSDVRLLTATAWPDGRPPPDSEEEADPSLTGSSEIGIFVYRRRGEVFLTEEDLAFFEAREAQLALVVAGDRAGFFVPEADGSFRTIRSYEEFSIGAERPAPDRAPTIQRRRSGRARSASAPPWGWIAAIATVMLAIPIAGAAYFAPLLPSPTIALAVSEREGQLMIRWNARSITAGAQLEIADGLERVIVPLAKGQSSATYRVRDGDLEISVTTTHGTQFARFITRPAAPAGDPVMDARSTEHARLEVEQLEAQLQQLRQAADLGRARIESLNGAIGRLTTP